MNSSELKGYITGLIIGDGYIDKGVAKRSFTIKSINKDFIYKIYEDLSSCSPFDIRIIPHKGYCDKNNVNHKPIWELRIKAHPYFAKKYHNFYNDYRKRIITRSALDWLTPNGLANWYMSDGYVCLIGRRKGEIRGRRVEICTDRYSKETIDIVCSMLKSKFGIEFRPIKRGSVYRIRLANKDYSKFINLIKDYVVTSMKYKLYLGYEKQPIWMSDSDWEFQNSISAIALTSKVEG